jgi:hypothetical protein
LDDNYELFIPPIYTLSQMLTHNHPNNGNILST